MQERCKRGCKLGGRLSVCASRCRCKTGNKKNIDHLAIKSTLVSLPFFNSRPTNYHSLLASFLNNNPYPILSHLQVSHFFLQLPVLQGAQIQRHTASSARAILPRPTNELPGLRERLLTHKLPPWVLDDVPRTAATGMHWTWRLVSACTVRGKDEVARIKHGLDDGA